MFQRLTMPIGVTKMSLGGYLALLALASLLVMSSSAYTSDPQTPDASNAQSELENRATTPDPIGLIQDGKEAANGPKSGGGALDSRQRSGRMYQQQQQQQQQQSGESYAAAYAAANSLGAGADQSANAHITQQATNDASAYSSFGESPPPPPPPSSLSAGPASSVSERGQQFVSGSPARLSEYPSSSYFASYMAPSSNEASYSGQPGHLQHHYYSKSAAPSSSNSLPLGYPTNAYERAYPMSSYYDRPLPHHHHHYSNHHLSAASSPFLAATPSFGSSSVFGGGNGGGVGGVGSGLMSSASSAISHWTNGFSVGEIICGLVALAIGAVILGAPFFLIYLALMGNFSGSGTLSLTNPTSSAAAAAGGASTTANGRRKRLAVFEAMNLTSDQARRHPDFAQLAESVVEQISPFVDLQQVSRTFKQLVGSIERYSRQHGRSSGNSTSAKSNSS